MKQTCNNCYNYYRASGRTLQMMDHCIESEYQPIPKLQDEIFEANNKLQNCKLWQSRPTYRK
jgi:predicted anti-sigma-YlaC factor YlaD